MFFIELMYKEEKKIDNTITSGVRRWLLKKYARKVSKLFHPTTLNVIGLIGFVFAGICFALSSSNRFWLIGAAFGVLVHLITDEFDGEVARIRKVTSEHGYYMDHMLDMIGILFVFVGLGISPLMHISVAFGIVILYYIMSISVFLTTYVVGNFQISFVKMGPREIRLLIALFALLSLINYPTVLFNSGIRWIGKVTLYDLAGFVCLFVLVVIAVHTITETIFYLKRFEKTYKVNSFFEYIQKTNFMRRLDKKSIVWRANRRLAVLDKKIRNQNLR